MSDKYYAAVGRRKEASARVKIQLGKGNVEVNGISGTQYFNNTRLFDKTKAALKILSLEDKYDLSVKVTGGGKNGQAEAIRHGVARALIKEDETRKPTLRKAGFVTRDPRAKERKKPGLKRARKAPQFSKR
ncbi:MAG: 30S ribosomal protein S9 [Patescibacteria group bacterium]|nr:30S ribosomal protein S9 [Patescibacteria group bacterium]